MFKLFKGSARNDNIKINPDKEIRLTFPSLHLFWTKKATGQKLFSVTKANNR